MARVKPDKDKPRPTILLCEFGCGCVLWSERKTDPDHYWLTFCTRHGGEKANKECSVFYWGRRSKP